MSIGQTFWVRIMLIITLISLIMALTTLDMTRTELFTAQYLSHRLIERVPAFHREWYRAFDDTAVKYICIEAMRGGAKSTVSENASLANICEGQDENITLVSRSGGTVGTATQIMGHVKAELETNDLMRQDYGLKQGKYWGEDRLQVIRGDGHAVNFYSMGKRSSIRGKRGTVIIDDPQNSDDCKSETVLARDEEWFLTDVLPVVIQEQRLIFIGTPISPLSLLCKIKEMPDFKVMSFPARDLAGIVFGRDGQFVRTPPRPPRAGRRGPPERPASPASCGPACCAASSSSPRVAGPGR